jgi:hypothetical protein
LGNLVERKTIKQDFEPKLYQLLELLESEMDTTKRIYDEQKRVKEIYNEVLVHRNMPDVSGALKWCQELRYRISKPMDLFKKLVDSSISHSEQMERVTKKYLELNDLLEIFAREIYTDWCNHVGKLSDNNLEKNLIVRDANTKTIKTNFDSQVANHIKKIISININYLFFAVACCSQGSQISWNA